MPAAVTQAPSKLVYTPTQPESTAIRMALEAVGFNLEGLTFEALHYEYMQPKCDICSYEDLAEISRANFPDAILRAGFWCAVYSRLAQLQPLAFIKMLGSDPQKCLARQYFTLCSKLIFDAGLKPEFLLSYAISESPIMCFSTHDFDFNIRKALKLTENRRPNGWINVAEWTRLSFADPSSLWKAEVDEVYAMSDQVDISRPLILAKLPSVYRTGEILIDGCHRLFKAYKKGKDRLAVHRLTLAESEECMMTDFVRPLYLKDLKRL